MQSGFSATRDSPHVHFPPSPSVPMRSSSCGQLNAGGKKSPIQNISIGPQTKPSYTDKPCTQAKGPGPGGTYG